MRLLAFLFFCALWLFNKLLIAFEKALPIIIALSICYLLFGCKTVKQIPVSTTVTTIEKLIPVYIPADSATLIALFGCDSLNNVYLKELSELKTNNVQSAFDLHSNTLTYKVVTVRDTVYIKGKETITERDVPVYVEVEKTVNRLTGWQHFQIWAGRILLAILAITAIYKVAKWKLSL